MLTINLASYGRPQKVLLGGSCLVPESRGGRSVTFNRPTIQSSARQPTIVFIVGPDRKIKLLIVYLMTTGRNFDKVMRVLASLQLTPMHKVAKPVNGKPGDDVIIAGSVSDEEAKKKSPQGWKAPKP